MFVILVGLLCAIVDFACVVLWGLVDITAMLGCLACLLDLFTLQTGLCFELSTLVISGDSWDFGLVYFWYCSGLAT